MFLESGPIKIKLKSEGGSGVEEPVGGYERSPGEGRLEWLERQLKNALEHQDRLKEQIMYLTKVVERLEEEKKKLE